MGFNDRQNNTSNNKSISNNNNNSRIEWTDKKHDLEKELVR